MNQQKLNKYNNGVYSLSTESCSKINVADNIWDEEIVPGKHNRNILFAQQLSLHFVEKSCCDSYIFYHFYSNNSSKSK